MLKNIVSSRIQALSVLAGLGALVALCGSSAPSRQSAGRDHTFTAASSGGWQLISAPYTYSQSFQQMGMYTAAWQPQQNSYAVTPTPPADAFHLGQGYWVYLTNNTTLPAGTGSADTTQNFSIALQPGWNMVGDPFTNNVPLTNVYFVDSQTGLSTQFPTAASSNGISPLFSYDPNAGSYTAVSDSSQSVQPWAGYWVYSFHAGSLVISPARMAASSAPAGSPITTLTHGGVNVPFVAGPLPPPSPSLADPAISISDPIDTNSPLTVDVGTLANGLITSDRMVVGVSGGGSQGYFDVDMSANHHGEVLATLISPLPANFSFTVQTIKGGLVSQPTALNLQPGEFSGAAGRGGGVISAVFSNPVNTNADTSNLVCSYVTGGLFANNSSSGVSLDANTPSLFDAGSHRRLIVGIVGPLVVGQTYMLGGTQSGLSYNGGQYNYGGGFLDTGGTLTITAIVGSTLSFTAHAVMGTGLPTDQPPPPGAVRAQGGFTLDLTGTVDIGNM